MRPPSTTNPSQDERYVGAAERECIAQEGVVLPSPLLSDVDEGGAQEAVGGGTVPEVCGNTWSRLRSLAASQQWAARWPRPSLGVAHLSLRRLQGTRLPNRRNTALPPSRRSAVCPCREVDVIDSCGSSPASARAARMASMTPLPSGSGAVMLCVRRRPSPSKAISPSSRRIRKIAALAERRSVAVPAERVADALGQTKARKSY